MSVEKLSDEVRTLLALAGHEGPTALRIIDQLTEALAAAERGRDSHYEAHVSAEQRALAAEARVRELEADQGGANRCIGELTAERDAANALLARVRASSRGRRWVKDIDAHLSAQPAAPSEHRCGVRGFAESGDECQACQLTAPTDHDRAVLEAMARVSKNALQDSVIAWDTEGQGERAVRDAAVAELARREAKR